MNPKVSVIIPVYNQAHYLDKAIESVLNQTLSDFEIIVVDDGSTDNTRQVVEAINDPRIHYMYQDNRGPQVARNAGILASNCQYIAFLDADDLFLPEKLELQIAFLDSNPNAGLVASGYFFIDDKGEIVREVRPWVSFPNFTLDNWLFGQPFIPAAILLRRTWLEHVGLFDDYLRTDEDWDLYLRLVQAGCEMQWIKQIVCQYRLHQGNASKDPAAMKAGGLAMFSKFFSNSTLPPSLKALQNSALARIYLDAAVRGYTGGFIKEAQDDLQKAIELDPSLLDGDPPQLLNTFVSWALTPYVNDPNAFLTIFLDNLPENLAATGWTKREVRGLLHAVTAFEYHKNNNRIKAAQNALLALIYDKGWVRNRGLLSLLLKP